ncbi:MAG: hypothetical protein NZM25_09895 [Leptospiraceae bacterium]|nr:hypothetical protein [Leptospiraceae bacterium]MDW8306470.1 hypothetical protein [Leptospiraceae bacterium]
MLNRWFLGFVAISWVLALGAVEYTVFVHGRSDKNHCGTGTTDVNNYWGDAKNLATPFTRYFVGYDGSTDPREWGTCRAQTNLWTVLYNQCRAPNNCKIICHSAGCYAVDYLLSTFPNITSTSGHNVRINFVMAIGSATGGSELADLAFWASSGMVNALKTGNARAFNHNITQGIPIWHIAGFNGWWYTAAMLPGEDDGAVAFHSECGKNAKAGYSQCLNEGTNWTNHFIWRDSSQSTYNASKQGYNNDHSNILPVARAIWNRYHGY